MPRFVPHTHRGTISSGNPSSIRAGAHVSRREPRYLAGTDSRRVFPQPSRRFPRTRTKPRLLLVAASTGNFRKERSYEEISQLPDAPIIARACGRVMDSASEASGRHSTAKQEMPAAFIVRRFAIRRSGRGLALRNRVRAGNDRFDHGYGHRHHRRCRSSG